VKLELETAKERRNNRWADTKDEKYMETGQWQKFVGV
jgi:hypothetical protein